MLLIIWLAIAMLASVESSPTKYITHRELLKNESSQLGNTSFVTRDKWKASKFNSDLIESLEPVSLILVEYASFKICHNITECTGIVQNLQQSYVKRGFCDIRYNFLIDPFGNVYEGLGWYHQEPKKLKHEQQDFRSIGFFGPKKSELTPKQKQSITDLIQNGLNWTILNEAYTVSGRESELVKGMDLIKEQMEVDKLNIQIGVQNMSSSSTFDNFHVTTEHSFFDDPDS